MNIQSRLFGNKLGFAWIVFANDGHYVLTEHEMDMVEAAFDDGLDEAEAFGDLQKFAEYEDAMEFSENG